LVVDAVFHVFFDLLVVWVWEEQDVVAEVFDAFELPEDSRFFLAEGALEVFRGEEVSVCEREEAVEVL